MPNYSNQDLNTNILKYIIPKLNATSDTLTDNFCVAATLTVGEASSSKFVYSYDGITWTDADSGNDIFDVCNCISFNGLLYLAGGYKEDGCGSGLAYSIDGKNWLPVNCSPFEGGQVCDIIWANGKWVACGSTEVGYNPFSPSASPNQISENGLYTAGCGDGIIASSSDGKWWGCEYTSCSVNVFTSLAYSGIYYMVGGNNHKIKWSKDAHCWHTVCGDKPCFTTALSYNNKMWVAAGKYGETAYSYCGTEDWNSGNYLEAFDNDHKIPNKLSWNGNVWVLVGYPRNFKCSGVGGIQIYYSTNGHCWNAAENTSELIDVVTSLTWNGSTWIAGGANLTYAETTCQPCEPSVAPVSSPAFIYSIDGINWTLNNRELLSGNQLTGNFNIFAIESRNIVNYHRACHTLSLNKIAYWIEELFNYTLPANSIEKISTFASKPQPIPSTDADDTNLADNKPSTVHIVPPQDS